MIDLLTALREAILISVFKLSPKVKIEIINDYKTLRKNNSTWAKIIMH